jgi:hypothetical protein
MGNSFSGDTGLSPLSGGNPTPICGFETSCINGCRSDFYRVSAGLGVIEFQTCAEAAETSFNPRMYLWEGSSSDCSTFSCASGTCIAKRGARVSSTRKGGNPSRGIFASSLFRSLPLSFRHEHAGLRDSCPPGSVGEVLQLEVVVGTEYILQVTGDTAAEFGRYNLEINPAEPMGPIDFTKIDSTYMGPTADSAPIFPSL